MTEHAADRFERRLRWMFGMWVGEVTATAAVVAAMFQGFAQVAAKRRI